MNDDITQEIPGVTSDLPTSLEELRDKITLVSTTEKQLYTNFLTRTAQSAVVSAEVLKLFLDNMNEELALHREHELQCRSQLMTEETFQTYMDSLTAMRLRQKETAAKRAVTQTA